MKLRKISNYKQPEYQDRIDHYLNRRDFVNLISKTAVLTGIVGTGIVNEKKKKIVKGAKIDYKQLDNQIAMLTRQLGDKSFKMRKKATKDLIKLGKTETEKKKLTEAQKKDIDHKHKAVMKAMKKALTIDDPEVKERARKIIAAISPIKEAPRHNNRPMIMGEMPAPVLMGKIRAPRR